MNVSKWVELILKFIVDIGLWAWATQMLSVALGWPFGRMALVTAAVVCLVNSCKPWASSKN